MVYVHLMPTNTVRLNERNRRIIRDRILNHAFSAREEAMAVEQKRVGLLIYNDVYPKDVQKKMAALPADYFPTANQLRVRFGAKENYSVVELGEYMPIAAAHSRYESAKEYATDDKTAAAFLKVKTASKALGEERKAKEREVTQILLSVQTIGGLLKTWPEIEKFVLDFKPTTPNGGAIMKSTRALNESLGLPPA